jgi:hypothetical protein
MRHISRTAAPAAPPPLAPFPGWGGTPFTSAEEAWFWVMAAFRSEPVRPQPMPPPCRREDVVRVIDTLYRQRLLARDHLCVLAHYGRRLVPPRPDRRRELRALALWREAFQHLTPRLKRRGIVI